MSKYSKYQRPVYEKPTDQHPVWRGIGCLFAVLLPVISYASAVLLVSYGLEHGWPFPPEITGYVQFEDWVWNTPVLSTLARPIANYANLWAVLVIFLMMLVMLSGIFTTLYAILRKITGPSRYSPVDVAPVKHKTKEYKR